MYKLIIIVFVGFIFSADSFIFNVNECTTDDDCTNGCCMKSASTSILGTHPKRCEKYLLPGASCYVGDMYHCGCDKNSTCEVISTAGVAIEAGSKVKGYCKPADGNGPQIAVEGGR
ncbi:uncharacterized protein LOC132735806 [Ruditapes philippinarum]|uniref:uncharacterized protein LOC132735806 n=1 Tax=Ruditapes philippinarum TaxID=129788 RepID=UPI00295B8DD4|nr:uncharacterized protein LOC132735806 [Ruditapes philippinarum]